METFFTDFTQSIGKVEALWKQIGWSEEEQQKHRNLLSEQLRVTLQETEKKYIKQKKILISTIAEKIDSIQSICEELGCTDDSYFSFSHHPLLQQLSLLEQSLSSLLQQKHERETLMEERQSKLKILHHQLDFEEHEKVNQINQLTHGVPIFSDIVLQRYDDCITECQKRRDQIEEEIKQTENDISEISKILDINVPLELQENESLVKYLTRLITQVTDLEETKMARKLQLDELEDILKSLWKSLEEDPVEKFNEFMEPYNEHALAEQVLLDAEALVQELKQNFHENLHRLLSKYRSSISALWEKLCESPEQHEEWKAQYFDQEITPELSDKEIESLLQEHVRYEAQLRADWEELAPIFKAIHHREQYIKKREEQEEKAKTDPNRWQGRGGRLLQEESERNRIAKQIKLSENYLRKEIPQWEANHQTSFLYNGTPFLQTLPEQTSTLSHISSTRTSRVDQKPSRESAKSRKQPDATPSTRNRSLSRKAESNTNSQKTKTKTKTKPKTSTPTTSRKVDSERSSSSSLQKEQPTIRRREDKPKSKSKSTGFSKFSEAAKPASGKRPLSISSLSTPRAPQTAPIQLNTTTPRSDNRKVINSFDPSPLTHSTLMVRLKRENTATPKKIALETSENRHPNFSRLN